MGKSLSGAHVLPIEASLPRIREILEHGSSLVLTASPGAGKTTMVPLALLESSWLKGKKLLMLEPRRVAARAAARRIAQLHGSPLGEVIGYHVRFDRVIGPRARVEILTEGLLTRRLQGDPFLEDIGGVIFDEFHERSLHADLSLALVREVQEQVRPDLRIVVMSATLAAGPVAHFLGDAAVLSVPGFLYPVETVWLDRVSSLPIPQQVAGAIKRAVVADASNGDVLAFLPGESEIYRTISILEDDPTLRGRLILPLHGSLPLERQDLAILPQEKSKIILSTNIAETSLTIEGVTTVVDSGLCRRIRLDPATGLEHLETERISRASADQRMGRAGRLRPGRAIRLWTNADHAALAADTPPEIGRADLTSLVLELAAWGKPDPLTLPWLEPPPPASLNAAAELLRELGAIDETGNITPMGKRMVELPVHPRQARLLLQAHLEGVVREGADLAALISEKDLVLRDSLRFGAAAVGPSDLLYRLDLLEEARAASFRRNSSEGRFDARSAQAIDRVAHQLRELMGRHGGQECRQVQKDEKMLRVLLAGYPDRVARRREQGGASFLMVGGRGLRIHSDSMVRDAEFIIAVSVDGAGGEGLVRMASRIEPEWLADVFPHAVREERELVWETARNSVGARRRTKYQDLILSETIVALKREEGETAAHMLSKEAAKNPRLALGWSEDADQLVNRISLARKFHEGRDLPLLDEAWMAEHLADFARGCRSFDELRTKSISGFLKGALSHREAATLEKMVPERITVPTGSHIRLEYQKDGPPILAVKLQELFGQTVTPCVCAGRFPVLIHLLSPAGRPLQITQDLANFWARVYPAMRKEMRGQYPRHPWPEDPLSAPPQRGVTRRR
ncbi:MAG: ATP-dependent helicase HrpB [Candidatus Ozemobacteraceae bacterium]